VGSRCAQGGKDFSAKKSAPKGECGSPRSATNWIKRKKPGQEPTMKTAREHIFLQKGSQATLGSECRREAGKKNHPLRNNRAQKKRNAKNVIPTDERKKVKTVNRGGERGSFFMTRGKKKKKKFGTPDPVSQKKGGKKSPKQGNPWATLSNSTRPCAGGHVTKTTAPPEKCEKECHASPTQKKKRETGPFDQAKRQ